MITIKVEGTDNDLRYYCYPRQELMTLQKDTTNYYVYEYGKRALVGGLVSFLTDINVLFIPISEKLSNKDLNALMTSIDTYPGTCVAIATLLPSVHHEDDLKNHITSLLEMMESKNFINVLPLHTDTHCPGIPMIYANEAAYRILNLSDLQRTLKDKQYSADQLPESVYHLLRRTHG